MGKRTLYSILIAGALSFPVSAPAQAEPEEIGAVTDEFRDAFFEALRQKGIGNHDKAITALEKCLKLKPSEASLYNELGKNQLLLKRYDEAYASFEKASQMDPANRWYLNGMYDVLYETKDWDKAIGIVRKLIPFDASLNEDLVSLYMNTRQFDKALALINEMNDTVGRSEKRDLYKADILSDPKYAGLEEDALRARIKKDPKDESAYLELILLYSNSGQAGKADAVTQQLEAEIPTSDWAQVGLFKRYLAQNDGAKAVAAMDQLLKSDKVDDKIKHRIINEFLLFTQKNPQYAGALEKAASAFSGDKQVKTAKEIGKFYQSKGDWDNAITYYEKDAADNPSDLETALLLLQGYTEKQDYRKMASRSGALIEVYPMQPELYYYNGMAQNQLGQFQKAKAILLSGIDYIVDSPTLEANFNIQIGEACNGLGDKASKEKYFLKAEKLLNQKK